MPKRKERTERFSIYLSPAAAETLRQKARKKGLKPGHVAGTHLEAYLRAQTAISEDKKC